MGVDLGDFQGALFDLDGTLVDTEPLHHESTNRVLRRWGRFLDYDAFCAYVGWAEEAFWRDLTRKFQLGEPYEKLAEERTQAYLGVLTEQAILPLPGVTALLAALRSRSIPCAIASSSPKYQILATVKAAGLESHFKAIVSGHDDVERGKPEPDVYEKAARELGLSPDSCVAFEDTETGVRSAQAAGCRVVLAPRPYTVIAEDVRPEWTVVSLEEVRLSA